MEVVALLPVDITYGSLGNSCTLMTNRILIQGAAQYNLEMLLSKTIIMPSGTRIMNLSEVTALCFNVPFLNFFLNRFFASFTLVYELHTRGNRVYTFTCDTVLWLSLMRLEANVPMPELWVINFNCRIYFSLNECAIHSCRLYATFYYLENSSHTQILASVMNLLVPVIRVQ